MSQTSDILDALRASGIPMNTEQLSEQLPHITRANISSLCSQLRKRELVLGQVENGKLAFSLAAGARPFQLDAVNLDEFAPDPVASAPTGDDTTDDGSKRDDEAPPAAQSFAVPSLDVSPDPSKPRAAAHPPQVEDLPRSGPPIADVKPRLDRGARLARDLAAAVLSRWPGEIPYDVQRLVNSAASLPL